eukprot:TCONS_00013052-protein
MNKDLQYELNIGVLNSTTTISIKTIYKRVSSTKESIKFETKIPVFNQVLVDDNGLIIVHDELIGSSNLHLAVVGDVPPYAESWLEENGVRPIKRFKLRFLTKADSLSITEYNTIYQVKRYIENQYEIQRVDQKLLFKGKEVNENQSVFSLMMADPSLPLSDEFGFDLVIKIPVNLRVVYFYKTCDREFQVEVHESDTVAEVKEKIYVKNKIPIQHIHLSIHGEEGAKLDDGDTRTMKELDLGPEPVLWMRPVILIHLKVPGRNSKWSFYEELTRLSTLESILINIQRTHRLQRTWLTEIYDKQGNQCTRNLNLFSSANTDEMSITVYPIMERNKDSCFLM